MPALGQEGITSPLSSPSPCPLAGHEQCRASPAVAETSCTQESSKVVPRADYPYPALVVGAIAQWPVKMPAEGHSDKNIWLLFSKAINMCLKLSLV